MSDHSSETTAGLAVVHSRLQEFWCQVLEVPETGLDDNFFEVGGDSFRAVMLTTLLASAGHELNVYEVFEAPTIMEQAALLMRRSGGS